MTHITVRQIAPEKDGIPEMVPPLSDLGGLSELGFELGPPLFGESFGADGVL